MIVCLDTNVLLQASKMGHLLEPIMKAWLSRRFVWALSTEILLEYREIVTRQSGANRWQQLSRVLDLAEKRGGFLLHVAPAFQFHIVTGDADDNKFTDCAITAHADFLVTEDTHFAPLTDAGYKPQPITPVKFIQQYCAVA